MALENFVRVHLRFKARIDALVLSQLDPEPVNSPGTPIVCHMSWTTLLRRSVEVFHAAGRFQMIRCIYECMCTKSPVAPACLPAYLAIPDCLVYHASIRPWNGKACADRIHVIYRHLYRRRLCYLLRCLQLGEHSSLQTGVVRIHWQLMPIIQPVSGTRRVRPSAISVNSILAALSCCLIMMLS